MNLWTNESQASLDLDLLEWRTLELTVTSTHIAVVLPFDSSSAEHTISDQIVHIIIINNIIIFHICHDDLALLVGHHGDLHLIQDIRGISFG